MTRSYVARALTVAVIVGLPAIGNAGSGRSYMKLVGTDGILEGRFTADVDVDTARDVAYVGGFDDTGVAVFDISNPASPDLRVLLDPCDSDAVPCDTIDVKVRGNLLAVADEPFDVGGFGGVTLYDLASDPFNPIRRGQFSTGSTHNVFIDPGYPARPFVYLANSDFAGTDDFVEIVDVSDLDAPSFVGTLLPSDEVVGCQVADCGIFGGPFASAHDLYVQEHPVTGRVLAYVAYWDAGLRIYDVTDPATPVEIGVFDVDPPANDPERLPCCIHYAQPTPSGDYVLIEEEVGVGDTGNVEILRADGCDGVNTCTLTFVSTWQPPQGNARQAPSYEAFVDTGAFNFGWLQRFFTWDVHNLDVREDKFIAAAYSAGIRVVDISDKTNPTEVAFFIPSSNIKDADKIGFQGREVWTARFGGDGLIYASDFWTGFYIVEQVSPPNN